MIQALFNLLLILMGIGCIVFWILALVNWDGECHSDNCDCCPYSGACPKEKGKDIVSEKEN